MANFDSKCMLDCRTFPTVIETVNSLIQGEGPLIRQPIVNEILGILFQLNKNIHSS